MGKGLKINVMGKGFSRLITIRGNLVKIKVLKYL